MNTEYKTTDKDLHYNKIFRYLYSNRSDTAKKRKEDEEFYYSDVEGTRSQFTKAQIEAIKSKYDIPISTKITYAIIQQLLSFITGSKPYPRIIPNSEQLKPFAYTFNNIQDDVWYESNLYDHLQMAWEDMLVNGSGFMRVRKNNFFQESTFNVIGEYVSWKDVLIDPNCKRSDFKDAKHICIAKLMPMTQAEKEFDITLEDKDCYGTFSDTTDSLDTLPNGFPDNIFDAETGNYKDKKDSKWVWAKEFFEAKETNIYLSQEGYISLKRPNPIQIPNPEKQALAQQVMQGKMAIQQMQMESQETGASAESAMEMQRPNPDIKAMASAGEAKDNASMQAEQATAMQEQVQQMELAMHQMPDTIPAFSMELESGEEAVANDFVVVKKRRIQRILQIGRRVIEEEILPTDTYPIHGFHLTWGRHPNKTYGIIHFTRDVIEAMNKFWGLFIYDMQLRNSYRVLYAEGTIVNPRDIEKKWSVPGAFIPYSPDPMLPDGGRPIPIEPSPMNQSYVQVLSLLTQLAEYITGIFGVVQGSTADAPATFGATQSLQSFGTQRVKLLARTIESPLSEFSYNIVRFLQKYCPKDKVMEYIDENQDGVEESILQITGDTRFRVRCQITNNLPTSRQMASVMLSTLAGQLADPQAQQLLTQYAMKFLDIEEADQIASQLDVVKQMQGQLEQYQQATQDLEGQLRAAQNNLAQKDITLEAEKQKMEIQKNSEIIQAEQNMQAEAQQQEQAPENDLSELIY